jgi:methionyl aminopeptidase
MSFFMLTWKRTDLIAMCSKVAKAGGYSINEEFSGHGIGQDFHSLPLIYHHGEYRRVTKSRRERHSHDAGDWLCVENDEPGTMEAGMAFTIEPMLCQGTPRSMTWPDGWTMATTDGGRSAQAEHTLLITQDSLEILTA